MSREAREDAGIDITPTTDDPTEPARVFADMLGRKLRLVGSFLVVSRREEGRGSQAYPVVPRRAARAVFYLCLLDYDAEKAEEARANLKFGDKDLALVTGFLNSLKEAKVGKNGTVTNTESEE